MNETLYYALATNFLFMLPLYKTITMPPPSPLYDRATYWYERKPFTCTFCMAFWLSLIGAVFIPLIWGGALSLYVPLTAPPLAALFEKIYKALPTVISR